MFYTHICPSSSPLCVAIIAICISQQLYMVESFHDFCIFPPLRSDDRQPTQLSFSKTKRFIEPTGGVIENESHHFWNMCAPRKYSNLNVMEFLICFSHRKSLISLPVVEFLLATLQVSEAVWIFENVRFLFDGHTLPGFGLAFFEVFAGLGGVVIFVQYDCMVP